jgi:hypothetical protein
MSESGGNTRRSSSIVAQQVTSVLERQHELAIIDENATIDDRTLGAQPPFSDNPSSPAHSTPTPYQTRLQLILHLHKEQGHIETPASSL